MSTTTEKLLERNFVKWCKDRDIVAIKGASHLAKGFPDRFLQLPNRGGSIYVEFKGDFVGLSPIQEWWRDYLRASSPHRYFVVDTPDKLERLKAVCEMFIDAGPELYKLELEYLNTHYKKE